MTTTIGADEKKKKLVATMTSQILNKGTTRNENIEATIEFSELGNLLNFLLKRKKILSWMV